MSQSVDMEKIVAQALQTVIGTQKSEVSATPRVERVDSESLKAKAKSGK